MCPISSEYHVTNDEIGVPGFTWQKGTDPVTLLDRQFVKFSLVANVRIRVSNIHMLKYISISWIIPYNIYIGKA